MDGSSSMTSTRGRSTCSVEGGVCWLMVPRDGGNLDARAGPLCARARLDGERAAVMLDDLVRDGEPEPGPAPWGLRREERLEDARGRLGRDPFSVVGENEGDAFEIPMGVERHA